MQYSYSAIVLLALAGLGQAAIPDCATTCIANAVASATTCGASDLVCQCSTANMNAIQAAATTCVLSACGAAEAVGKIVLQSSRNEI
jgi:hypothetical protein